MATVKIITSKAKVKKIIDYITDGSKTENGRLVSGVNCQAYSMANEMTMTKQLFSKENGRSYFHGIISFAPSENVTPELAHHMALELIDNTEAFRGFEVGVSTHVDKAHIHSHFVVNSVSFIDGKKLQFSKKQLAQFKLTNDNIVAANGLSVTVKGKKFDGSDRRELTTYDNRAYKMLEKAQRKEAPSYIRDIALEVLRAKNTATSRQEMADILATHDIHMDWRDNRKHVVFTDLIRQAEGQNKHKVRLETINKYYGLGLSKEGIEDEWRLGNGRSSENEAREQKERQLSCGNEAGRQGNEQWGGRTDAERKVARAEQQRAIEFAIEVQDEIEATRKARRTIQRQREMEYQKQHQPCL